MTGGSEVLRKPYYYPGWYPRPVGDLRVVGTHDSRATKDDDHGTYLVIRTPGRTSGATSTYRRPPKGPHASRTDGTGVSEKVNWM